MLKIPEHTSHKYKKKIVFNLQLVEFKIKSTLINRYAKVTQKTI